MTKPPIFILGSGRSGSTLLQRILNSYPDITIWGEHGGFLKETAAAFFRILENRGNNQFVFSQNSANGIMPWELILERKKPQHWQAWLNLFAREQVLPVFRRHLESFFRHPSMPNDHHWGFKEIRYGNNDRVVEFLSCLYPDARFIFLVRNAFDTLASQERAFACRSSLGAAFPSRDFRDACRSWTGQTKALWTWHVSGKLSSFWVSYDDLSSNLACLEPLLTSLGKDAGPTQQGVLAMEEGRGSAFASKGKDRWKALGLLQLCWAELAMGNVNDALGYSAPRRVSWLAPLRRCLARGLGTKPRAASERRDHALDAARGPAFDSVVARASNGPTRGQSTPQSASPP
jgi:hypothetical protein